MKSERFLETLEKTTKLDPRGISVNVLQDFKLEIPKMVFLSDYEDYEEGCCVFWDELSIPHFESKTQSQANCLRDFLLLADVPLSVLGKRVLTFVRRWGPLAKEDITTHKLPIEKIAMEFKKNPTDPKWLAGSDSDSAFNRQPEDVRLYMQLINLQSGTWYREPIVTYQRLARCVRTAIQLGNDPDQLIIPVKTENRQLVSESLDDLVMNAWQQHDAKLPYREKTEADYQFLERYIEKYSGKNPEVIRAEIREKVESHLSTHWFTPEGLTMQVSIRPDERGSGFRFTMTRPPNRAVSREYYQTGQSDGLEPEMTELETDRRQRAARLPSPTHALLAFQIIQAINDGSGFCRCDICHELYTPRKRKPRANAASLCQKKECHDEQHRINESRSYQRRRELAKVEKPAEPS